MPKENSEDVIASQAKEFNLKQGDLAKAVREKLASREERASLVARRIAERIMAGEITSDSDVIASQAKEFNLEGVNLNNKVREELTSLVARRIAERIMAGEITPPPKKKIVVGVVSKRRTRQ